MSDADDLVARWLAELQDELRNVDARVRDRVVRDVARRIEAERESGADVRTVLAEAGNPLDIAADVRERHGVRERSNWREIAAVVLLPFGGVVIPFAGWFVRLFVLRSTTVGTVREKAGATLVLPFGVLLPLLLLARSPYFAFALLAPVATGAYLALRLRV
jgi:hypothetical protein